MVTLFADQDEFSTPCGKLFIVASIARPLCFAFCVRNTAIIIIIANVCNITIRLKSVNVVNFTTLKDQI